MPTTAELIPLLIHYWEYTKKLFSYAQFCVKGDLRDPACGDFWTWVLYASLAVAAIVVFRVGKSAIMRQLEYRKLEKMLEARKVVADDETMKQVRWIGDDVVVSRAPNAKAEHSNIADLPPEPWIQEKLDIPIDDPLYLELTGEIQKALAVRTAKDFRRTYYEIIGVSHDAGAEQITAACISLGDKYHPDKNVGDELAANAFSEIEKIFETLTDPQKRALYDKRLLPR